MNTELLLDRLFVMIAIGALTFVVGGMILNWLTRPPRTRKGRKGRFPPR